MFRNRSRTFYPGSPVLWNSCKACILRYFSVHGCLTFLHTPPGGHSQTSLVLHLRHRTHAWHAAAQGACLSFSECVSETDENRAVFVKRALKLGFSLIYIRAFFSALMFCHENRWWPFPSLPMSVLVRRHRLQELVLVTLLPLGNRFGQDPH